MIIFSGRERSSTKLPLKVSPLSLGNERRLKKPSIVKRLSLLIPWDVFR